MGGPSAAARRLLAQGTPLPDQADEISGVGTWVWDSTSGRAAWSRQVHRIFGTDPGGPPATFETFLTLVHDDDRDALQAAARYAVLVGRPHRVDFRIVRPDGEIREVHSNVASQLAEDGTLLRVVGSVGDVTAARRTARELERTRDLFAGVLDAATEQSIIVTDADGVITVFNHGAESMLGYRAADVIGRMAALSLHDAAEIDARAAELGIEPGFAAVVGTAAHGEPETREWTYRTKTGGELRVMVSVSSIMATSGGGFIHDGFIQVGTNRTAQHAAERALLATEALFEGVFRHAPTGILLADVSAGHLGEILRVNPAMTSITGYSHDQLRRMNVTDLTHPDHLDAHRDRFRRWATGDNPTTEAERRWVHADGRDLWVQFNVNLVTTREGRCLVGLVEDITGRKQAEERLGHLALHDPLTGLPNRALLLDRLEHALESTTRFNARVAALYLDLDGFKRVNDNAGHLVGDEILVMVANRLRDHVRPGDTVARLGGDEFVVVCADLTNTADVHAVADRLLAAIAEPYLHGGEMYYLTTSIGVALATGGTTAKNLLHDADDAMYVAKAAGKNRIYRSDAQDAVVRQRTVRAVRQAQVEGELQLALQRNELLMYGHPVHSLVSGRIAGVEMVLHWEHPIRGLVGPSEFLDVAESSPLMRRIGQRVLAESCRMAATWPATATGFPPMVLVNVSGRELESGSLRADVLAALDSSQLSASRLVLEVAETYAPLMAGPLLDDLNDLRGRGVRLAIDDVGTGYSSLTRLTELPADILKIDHSFVGRIGRDVACDAIVTAIVSIGRSLGLEVIAEGVETAAQVERLAGLGCALAQGFYFSRPEPGANILGLLSNELR